MSGKRALLNMDEAAKTIVNCITSMKTEYYGKLIDFNSGSKCDAFLPLLEKSASQLEQPDIKQSSVINISSIMSSLELVKSLPYYYDDYQCSKVALNMLTICMEMDTDKAPLTIVAAAKNILECLQAMINEQHCKLIDTSDGKN
ncbi:unnamed protein product [Rotaria magnacalcarata]|uniref:Uncharacterized protein n=1 Tax=Rotaria magnacalcarata TaxID=392030 RepID=A0A818Y8B1_9BILA|nr:unnamed protein product [Rotaria magnacalcarata]CAF3768740.1 unnamed protein product [Rotaria magnacalcarata]CAF3799228.1 unnamed protein product [Rotaria magnacalcarata]CAF3897411.1 unnamed protein product [Rotaria magnacalcarata]